MNLKGSWFKLFGCSWLSVLLACGPKVETPRSYIAPRYIERIENDPREKNEIEVEFIPIVSKFEAIWGKIVSTPMFFSNSLKPEELGVCITWSSNSSNVKIKEIKINKNSFDRNELSNEMIIFHELGHCELDRDHLTTLALGPGKKKVPFSLMFPSIFNLQVYRQFNEHYVLELFDRGYILQKSDETSFIDNKINSESVKSEEVLESNGFTAKIQY